MDADGATIVRKHVRAVLVTPEVLDTTEWVEAVREDLSLVPLHAASVAEALALIDQSSIDVALIALSVCDGSYRDALRALQAKRGDLPVLIVAALDHGAMREALALGASDIVAPSDLARLGPAVTRALRDAVMESLLLRTRSEVTLLEEALRRTRDDLAIVAIDERMTITVYAARPDLIGRPLTELPFLCDGEEGEELAAAVASRRSTSLMLGFGSVTVEPFSTPLTDRRYAAVTIERGGRGAVDERDPVTGLPQRAAFERIASGALAEAEREGVSGLLLFLDVDRFHVVNELGGHAAGDGVLRDIATRLRVAVPDGHVARFAGDEFVMLRIEETSATAQATIDAVVDAFATPFMVESKPVFLTASIGVAHMPDDAGDILALIATAEAASFEAKRWGRNTVRSYRSPKSSVERVLTRRDLHGAIERAEFELYYQPMYDIETRAIHGVEALLRWRHPVHGLMPPDRFIPVAEEFGLIDEIGAWVLNDAIAQVRAWADAGIPAVRVSVNVSARQFESDALPALVAKLLARHNVAASSLEIEVTESSIMRDVTAALRLLVALRELGVRVSIDDFGTGYTSLGFLKRFPVDMLKIDRTFVAGIADGTFDDAVVRAVTTLARGLGVRTVAEGVELQEQLDRLRALDCDVVQGFLLCHPLPAAACTPLLQAALLAN